MSFDKINTISTSYNSANTDDIVVRQTTKTRLIFRPQLVNNTNNPQASVHGTFIFQKKGINDSWNDFQDSKLSDLKNGEGVSLSLRSQELLDLYAGITKLYRLYQQQGLPQGNQTFVNVSNRLQAVANLSDDDFNQLVETGNDVGLKALLRLLKWANSIKDISTVLDQLEGLNVSNLQKIHTIAGMATLHDALKVWSNNSTNSSEQFWQSQFTEHFFLLEQIFSYPVLLIKQKAYLGGKSVYNDGGNYCDFLYKNALTHSAILVEIKAPTTPLLRTEYRDGIYNASAQLTGAILQVLDYRKSLTEEFRVLGKDVGIEVCDPPCKVIIGNSLELDGSEKKKSFELFRRHFNGVEVLTYDEVFLRISNLLNILEG